MAKFTGTQSIPAELADQYSAALGNAGDGADVRKRYPFRMPRFQDRGFGPSAKQRAHRQSFKTAVSNFQGIDTNERSRWYAAEPEWNSFLWYYNYFIMSSLAGNANLNEGGSGLIKSIQLVQVSIGAGTATGTGVITAIDVDKSVVMVNGASIAEGQTGDVPYATTVNAYVSALTSTLVSLKWSLSAPFGDDTKAATVSALVIEYI